MRPILFKCSVCGSICWSTATRVIMKFDVPTRIAKAVRLGHRIDPGTNTPGRGPRGSVHIPSRPRMGGAEYLWTCHMLEHENTT
jgi:hypothetical protein